MFQTTRSGSLYNPEILSTWRIETHKQRRLHNLHQNLHLKRPSRFDRVDDWMTAFQQRVPKLNFETMFVKRVDISDWKWIIYSGSASFIGSSFFRPKGYWETLRPSSLVNHWLLYFLLAIAPATGDEVDSDLYKCLLLIIFLQVISKR